jgi:hypothetical protein
LAYLRGLRHIGGNLASLAYRRVPARLQYAF